MADQAADTPATRLISGTAVVVVVKGQTIGVAATRDSTHSLSRVVELDHVVGHDAHTIADTRVVDAQSPDFDRERAAKDGASVVFHSKIIPHTFL